MQQEVWLQFHNGRKKKEECQRVFEITSDFVDSVYMNDTTDQS